MKPGATVEGSPITGGPNGSLSPMRWTTAELAARLQAELIGPGDVEVSRLEALDRADTASLTFIRDARHAANWPRSRAGAALVSRGAPIDSSDGRPILLVADADHALIQVLEALTPPAWFGRGVHPDAVVHPSAEVGRDVSIASGAHVGPRTVVGDGTVLHAGVVIGADVRLGAGCELRANVVVEDRCTLGDRVRIHAGAVIGADGFGYRPSADGRSLVKVPHAGAVEIGDDVEIGANTTIDRGKFGPTTIGAGTKIDNLVQIAHNCRVGRSVIICGCCALAGSVRVGDGAVLAGGAAIADNLEVGAGAKVGARSGVMHNVPAGESWAGYPASPARQALRIASAQQQLPDLISRIKRALKSGAIGADEGDRTAPRG